MARYKACNRAKRAVRVNSSVRTPPLVLSTNGRHPVVFSQPKDRCAGYADAGRAIVPQSGFILGSGGGRPFLNCCIAHCIVTFRLD